MANDATPSPGATPSPAETMRQAAALMRERAEAAGVTVPSPWFVDGAEITTDDQEPIEPLARSARDPAVALAVADWLDFAAELAEASPSFDRRPIRQRALAVARAYLGATV